MATYGPKQVEVDFSQEARCFSQGQRGDHHIVPINEHFGIQKIVVTSGVIAGTGRKVPPANPYSANTLEVKRFADPRIEDLLLLKRNGDQRFPLSIFCNPDLPQHDQEQGYRHHHYADEPHWHGKNEEACNAGTECQRTKRHKPIPWEHLWCNVQDVPAEARFQR